MTLLTLIPSTSTASAGGLPLLLSPRPMLSSADADVLLDTVIEGDITLRAALRILLAGIAGKRQGLGTATEEYMAQDGTTPRITFTPSDEHGNGTTVVDGA